MESHNTSILPEVIGRTVRAAPFSTGLFDDRSLEIVYTLDDREICRWLKDDKGGTLDTIGELPADCRIREYHENGVLARESEQRNGARAGVIRNYDRCGNLLRELDLAGEPNTDKRFYCGGGIQEVRTLGKNGRHGPTRYYDRNGSLRLEMNYRAGRLNGLSRCLQADGRLIYELPIENDLPHGTAKYYHENGQLRTEVNYVHGRLHGVYRRYSHSGELLQEIKYINDRIEE